MSSASASHLGQNGSSAASTQPRRKSHTWSQLKLVIPGGAITYFLGTIQEFSRLLDQTSSSWARTVALVAMAHGAATVALFIYVLLTPWLKGVEPDFKRWREHGVLSWVIPILSASIVIGWLLSVLALGQWSSLGYLEGIIAVCSLYALTFGLLGLIPAPKLNRK
ncbi:hypothetical protein AX16_002624 [Volvariella volvacea WC 439]|nr:hypothetical protein AX16_002624 [Volvariella volvacea WC 439]